ncbi:MAG: flagellar hook-associated protein FlgL [Methylococcales bacterium]
MRISTAYPQQFNTVNMTDLQSKLNQTQMKISSGKNYLTPSENPSAAAYSLSFKQSIAEAATHQDNIATASQRLSLEETTLASVIDTIQRLQELGLQGVSDSGNSTVARHAIAAEFDQLNQHLIGLANTRNSNGEYLFAGVKSTVMPFSQANANPTTPAVVTTPVTNITTAATDTTALAVDPAIVDSTLVDPAAAATVNTPVSAFTYFGSNTQRSIQIGTGRTITDGDTGTATFTSAKTGLTLFDTVKNFATELRADKPTLETLQALDDAFTQISTVRSNVGARINALDRQKTTNQDFIINNQTALSQIEDLDYATAITTLNTQQNSLQAAQQSYAKVQGMSLFKYL